MQALHELCKSIRTFNRNSSLRHTSTKDNSSAQLMALQRQFSITSFDLSSLRHVKSVDKSEPLHIYKLVQKERENQDSFFDSDENGGRSDPGEEDDVFSNERGDFKEIEEKQSVMSGADSSKKELQ